MRSQRKATKGKLIALRLDGVRYPLNAKGKHVTAIVRAQRRDLKAITRSILEQKAAAASRPPSEEGHHNLPQETVDSPTRTSQLVWDDFTASLPLSQIWEDPNCEVERDWDSPFEQGFNLEPFGDL
jgi:hypothetical protein